MSAALNSKRSRRPRKSAVQQLPVGETPSWLRSLLITQKVSLIAAFGLAGAVLMLYGWTVYSQQLWGKEYRKLEQLRRNERQYAASSEVLKNQIVKQSDQPGTVLVPQTPDSLIFLKSAAARPQKPAAPTAGQASPTAPLGY